MYSLVLAFQSFFRNFWLSVVSIVMIFLMLFSLSVLGSLNILFDYSLDFLKNKVDLSIYLKDNLTEDQINSFRTELENLKAVKSVDCLTPEEALEEFKQIHQGDPIIMKALDEVEENPFGASFAIKLVDPSKLPLVVDKISSSQFRNLIQDEGLYNYKEVTEILKDISRKLQWSILAITLFFTLIAILVIFNTIRLGIYSRANEIAIMRLVGAKMSFIRAPFLIEAVLYALFAWLANLAIFSCFIKLIDPYLTNFFGQGFIFSQYFQKFFWPLFGLLGVFSLILVILSGAIAIYRYLKV